MMCSSPLIGFSGETVNIPSGKPITVDGVADPNEWDDAADIEFRGGDYIKIKQDGTYLLMAIKGEKLGISSLAFHSDDEVRIFHASSGLITAVYKNQGDHWVQTEEFRSEGQILARAEDGDEAKMAKNLELYGWCANILAIKPPADFDEQNITEFKISLDHFENGASTMSVVFSQRTAEIRLAHAPIDLADGSLNNPMVHGSNVEVLQFEPQTWLLLKW